MNSKSLQTFLLIVSFMCFGYSQDGSNKPPHYVLPEFTEGTILMKDGSELTEVLNYNSLSENFAFKKDDEILAMTQTDIGRIDTVYVSNRKFIRKDGVFLEVLMRFGVELYLEHKCNLESSTAASSGYGGTSQTTSGRTITSIENRGNLYQLELPETYKAKPYKEYWIYKDDALTKFKTLGQLKKLYKDQKKDIKTYRKSHDLDTKEPLSIVKLIEYLESLD